MQFQGWNGLVLSQNHSTTLVLEALFKIFPPEQGIAFV